MSEKRKDPPQRFQVQIQAATVRKITEREAVPAFRKEVTAKCCGGDATGKRKLLDKQKESKKKMRQFGRVEIPREAFVGASKMEGSGFLFEPEGKTGAIWGKLRRLRIVGDA